MLTELHIENLGVIEHATLRLGHGLTALTGETGAGKTLLVEAIELLVGGRADAAVVRTGAAEARVDGRLVVATPGGFDEVVVTRVVPAEGRSRAYVDGRPATVASLAELTRDLVDLHGQHAHQSLLSPHTQRGALDEFGSVDLQPLRQARAALTEIDATLATLGGDERARAREIDLLRFQVTELDAAAITDPDEDAALAREEEVLADAVAHRQAGHAAIEALGADGGGADAARAALHALGAREPYDDLIARVRSIAADIDDVVAELRSRAESIDEDPERLDQIRVRRQLLVDLRRKYGADLGEVMAFHDEARARLAELEQYERRAASLDADRRAAVDAERIAAAAVGRRRREVAPALAAAVEEQLRRLAMPAASVVVSVGNGPDDHPGDDVRFMMSANPGAPVQPLAKVASGGELARAMLALRLVLSGAGTGSGAPTLVFDEVDAGIGGEAAIAVGDALASLAETHQVLVVTHLAQVAAVAETQLKITKIVTAGTTSTEVEPVTDDRRVDEIARMLAGSLTDPAREHARDLLDRASTA